MKGLFLVEPVVAMYAFSSFLIYPLIQQYVYRRLWEDLTNTTYPTSDNSSRCGDSSSNHSSYNDEVQRQASLFSLYTELFSTVPSMIVTLMLVAYSDRGGRKIAIIMPLVGTLLYSLSFLAVSYFELNIYLLIASSLVSALFGGLGTFLGGCFAYVADLCEDGQQKTLRMAGLDMMIGLLAGMASISTGYFLRAAGFNWPFVTSALIQVLILLYAIFILEETVKKPPADAFIQEGSTQHSALKQMTYGVYEMFTGASRRCKTILTLLMLIFTSFSFAYVGGISLMTLYTLNKPLCWNEILIGYGSALSTTVFLVSFAGVFVFTSCGVPQLLIVLIGILSVVTGMVLVAFTKTTLMMFIVKVPMLLSIMPFPVMRSMMSKLISKSQQGALFALLSFLENMTNNVSGAVFNSVYAATVAWFPGFIFLLSAGLCVIPVSVLGVVAVYGVDVSKEDKEVKEDKDPETLSEDQNDNTPLLS
ncbi:lysosomal proton-coupled steroid conjugate and bile acid symporter SLC46A3 isoform X2 [Platichthys flesus]|uniref:lysosomal proton-coupled steroid conjugate and bile acid symporter SLC46A3 isoform X2 n=1 Tax=Platichthys flesus TaxID=8260 RepID=UPI002DBA577C|nr:lysosomal proton-coupled steroid conjugate and bile acid symporter SLC46A3 isoform X2 [Platichthys flesus]